MEEKQKKLLPPWVSVSVGVLTAFFVFAVATMQVILLFGERGSVHAASRSGLILSILSALVYAASELAIYPRSAQKSLLALSYFSTFALLAVISFGVISAADLTYAFDFDAETGRALLLSGCYRLCAANAVALVLRIGIEIGRYVKNLLRL